MGPSLQIDFSACFLLAMGLMILPASWLLAAVLAVVIHEVCHWLTAYSLGVPCLGLEIGAGGIRMALGPMDKREEFLVTAAGPLGSMFLLTLMHVYPQLAICAGVQGIYNLLPIYPLDGGRMLRCLFSDRYCRMIETGVMIALLGFGLWLWQGCDMGAWPLMLIGIATGKAFLRKIPCKPANLRVQ